MVIPLVENNSLYKISFQDIVQRSLFSNMHHLRSECRTGWRHTLSTSTNPLGSFHSASDCQTALLVPGTLVPGNKASTAASATTTLASSSRVASYST